MMNLPSSGIHILLDQGYAFPTKVTQEGNLKILIEIKSEIFFFVIAFKDLYLDSSKEV